MDTGEKIHALRLSKGMTLEELGTIVGVGKSTVRKWETGIIANMRRDKIANLSAALGVSPAYLMGWEEVEDQDTFPPLTAAEESHMRKYRKLSDTNKVRIDERIDILLEDEREALKRASTS